MPASTAPRPHVPEILPFPSIAPQSDFPKYDCGKAVEAMTSKVTTIGPVYTLAPRVWVVARDGPYTAKIDTWAYEYAIAEVLASRSSRVFEDHPGSARIEAQDFT